MVMDCTCNVVSSGSSISRLQHLCRSLRIARAAEAPVTPRGRSADTCTTSGCGSPKLDSKPPTCHGQDLLDMSVVAKFDPEAFARDGLWIWEGVLTPKGRAKIKEACMRTQRMNDMWNEHDWQQYDWESHRLRRPSPVDREKLIAARGGGQMGVDPTAGSGINVGGLQDRAGIRAPWGPGFKPEGCCLAWDRQDNPLALAAGLEDDWCLMNLITHPQMLEAHRLMLGPTIRFDHNTILSRKEGYTGQGWHGHDYYDDDHFTWKEGQGYVHTMSGGGARGHKDKFLPLDPADPCAQFGPYVPGRDGPIHRCGPTELGLVRSLIYPDGFAAEGDGGVKLVKGGHWHRSFLNPRTPPDDVFRRDWLDGRTHPITGEPLQIYSPAVAPGTMVSILHHMPHAVSPRYVGRGTRWCTLFSYRAPDPEKRIYSPTFTGMVPWELEEDCAAGRIPGLAADKPNLFSNF